MHYVVECASGVQVDQLIRRDAAGCYRLLLHRGEQWRPVGELEAAQSECHAVANYCDVTALVADKATKDAFLQELRTATVLHIGAINKTQLSKISPCIVSICKFVHDIHFQSAFDETTHTNLTSFYVRSVI